jgi:hypothetical protein
MVFCHNLYYTCNVTNQRLDLEVGGISEFTSLSWAGDLA